MDFREQFLAAWGNLLDTISPHEDFSRDGLWDTPRRILGSHRELFRGYHQDPQEILSKVFDSTLDQMVVVNDIEFYSMCEHHFLPFFGRAHVGYIPQKKVVGLSKIARLVDCYSRRLQLQERLTEQIAHALMDALQPAGVGVVLEAQHLCLMSRGVQKQASLMVTSCMLGVFRSESEVRNEFLNFCQLSRRP